MFDEKKIKDSINEIRARLDNMEFSVKYLEQKELCFFNSDIQHIFDSLLDIDEQTHFCDGIYRNYAEYLSGKMLLRSRGIILNEKARLENMIFNYREHNDE